MIMFSDYMQRNFGGAHLSLRSLLSMVVLKIVLFSYRIIAIVSVLHIMFASVTMGSISTMYLRIIYIDWFT
jgi:hypothetical protein